MLVLCVCVCVCLCVCVCVCVLVAVESGLRLAIHKANQTSIRLAAIYPQVRTPDSYIGYVAVCIQCVCWDLMRAVSLARHCSGVELSSGGTDSSSDTPVNSCTCRNNIYYIIINIIQN